MGGAALPPVPVHPAGVAVPRRRRSSLGGPDSPPGEALLSQVHAVHLDGPAERPLTPPRTHPRSRPRQLLRRPFSSPTNSNTKRGFQARVCHQREAKPGRFRRPFHEIKHLVGVSVVVAACEDVEGALNAGAAGAGEFRGFVPADAASLPVQHRRGAGSSPLPSHTLLHVTVTHKRGPFYHMPLSRWHSHISSLGNVTSSPAIACQEDNEGSRRPPDGTVKFTAAYPARAGIVLS